uniref:HIRAN domain-containing protein n=1 Tax=Amphimedon queenslandica TaxID=400682 RepID=A0A1X7TWR3_AMPQE
MCARVSRVITSESKMEARMEQLTITSFVRGYHAYQDFWTPQIGEILELRREPENIKDNLAVAVVKSDAVVGHVPYNLAPTLSHFLNRGGNTGTAEITGSKLNRGGGYGLEVPCIYRLCGAKKYIEKMRRMNLDNDDKDASNA